MNAANKLTMARIVLIPIFMVFAMPVPTWVGATASVFIERNGSAIALFLFILAAFTDLLDGYIARRKGLVTDTGKFLDPLADKLLIAAAMVALVAAGDLSGWICVLILAREFAVTGIRTVAAAEGYVIAANRWGKSKTLTQITAVCVSFAPFAFTRPLMTPLWILALCITAFSGYTYVKEFFRHVK